MILSFKSKLFLQNIFRHFFRKKKGTSLWESLYFTPFMLALLFRLGGLVWGLPASDGWDNDGVAPRDILSGIYETFSPKEFYVYPPLQLLLLLIFTLPIWLWAWATAEGHSLHEWIPHFIHPKFMTPATVMARALTILMSLALSWVVAEMTRQNIEAKQKSSLLKTDHPHTTLDRITVLDSNLAAKLTFFLVSLNTGYTYYSQTSNLDVPSLFWVYFALYWGQRSILNIEKRKSFFAFRLMCLSSICALCTKDQTYASLIFPLFFLTFIFTKKKWPSKDRSTELFIVKTAALSIFFYAFLSGAMFNPTGFIARLRFLTGSASSDYIEFEPGVDGFIALTKEIFQHTRDFFPPLLAFSFLPFGFYVMWKFRTEGSHLLFLAGISTFLFFNCVAKRSDTRFILPLFIAFSQLIALGASFLVSECRRSQITLKAEESSKNVRRFSGALSPLFFFFPSFIRDFGV